MFIDVLEKLCQENKTTVTQVLKALGLSTSKGTAWRNGSIPNGEILEKLADYFGVSIDYLMGRTPYMRPEDNPASVNYIAGIIGREPTEADMARIKTVLVAIFAPEEDIK